MKKALKVLSLALCLAMLFSVGVSAKSYKYYMRNELPTTESCTFTRTATGFNLNTPYAGTQSFSTKNGDISFYQNSVGVWFSYNNTSGYSISRMIAKNMPTISLKGDWDNIVIGENINYIYTIDLAGGANSITIAEDCKLTIEDTDKVATLQNDGKATVMANGVAIESYNYAPDSALELTITQRSYTTRTSAISYDEQSKVLSITASQPDVRVDEAIKDALFVVKQVNGAKAVSGSWNWPNFNGNSTESGSYAYIFSPSDKSNPSIYITINFTAL